MKFGIAFFASIDGGETSKYDTVLDVARYADTHGFNSVWLPERHFHRFGGISPNPAVLGAAIAIATTQISIRAGSVVVPLHDPIRIVEEWSMVDNLSGGRVELSFASGWNADDFVFFPERYANRRVVTVESISQVQRLWAGGVLRRKNGKGRDVGVPIYPKPLQAHLPVWMTSAGSGDTIIYAAKNQMSLLTHVVDQSFASLKARVDEYKALSPTGVVALMLHTYVGRDESEVDNIAGPALRQYIVSGMGLELQAQVADQPQADDSDPSMIRELAELSYERYRSETSLIGSASNLRARIGYLQSIGIDEIACLVDFGLPKEQILASLDRLNELKRTIEED